MLLWPKIGAALLLLLFSGIRTVLGLCKDPGIPQYARRTVISPDRSLSFPVKTVIKYWCTGKPADVTKVICRATGKWSAKPPKCKAHSCPTTIAAVEHATQLTPVTPGVTNIVGNSVKYGCNKGYMVQGGYPYKVCGKDGKWHGNFTCVVVTCQKPEAPLNGNVSYKSLNYGSVAGFTCDDGYYLIGTNHSTCSGTHTPGRWSGSRSCLIECHLPSYPNHGYYIPHYHILTLRKLLQGSFLVYRCEDRYELKGDTRRYCQSNGKLSKKQPTCKINMCGSPGKLENGRMTFKQSPYFIGTHVSFVCNPGYRLDGLQTRECLSSGAWSGLQNPTCTAITCEEPDIQNGQHDHMSTNGRYSYRQVINYTCYAEYYLWGNTTRRCSTKGGVGYWTGEPPLCLTLVEFDKKCVAIKGQFVLKEHKPLCLKAPPKSTPSTSKTKIHDNNELDTLTIVTASAGSTLGALVILLSILVFVRRFHRSRRFRNSVRGRSLYGDDDRLTLIATYSGDVHFQLPSYDEAMSQVHRDPPPFESVVEGATGSNNNPLGNGNTEAVTEEDTQSAPVQGNHPDNEGESTDGQVNIVENPLVGTPHEGGADTPLTRPEESGSTSNRQATNFCTLQSQSSGSARGSISDEDSSQSETQPLISSV